MWTIFNVFIVFVRIFFCFLFWFSSYKAYGMLAPWPGIEPAPLASEGEVLTSGLSGKFLFLFLNCKSCFYILDEISYQLYAENSNVFFCSISCFFTFLIVSFDAWKFKILMKSNLSIFFLWLFILLVLYLRFHCLGQGCKDLHLFFLLQVF